MLPAPPSDRPVGPRRLVSGLLLATLALLPAPTAGAQWEPSPGDRRELRPLAPFPHASVGLIEDTTLQRRSLQVSFVFLCMAAVALWGTHVLQRKERQKVHRQLERLNRQILSSQEEERQRISRDLHDDLGGLLTGVNLELQLADRTDDEDKRRAAVKRAIQSTRQALDRVRQISSVLRPTMLDDLGLRQSIATLLDEFEARTGVAVHKDIDFDVTPYLTEEHGHVFRILQEVLTNVTRHAQARHVHVRLGRRTDAIELEVVDDGVGFEPDRVSPELHMGLDIMRERARQLGGRLQVTSAPGQGSRVLIRFPQGGNRTEAGKARIRHQIAESG